VKRYLEELGKLKGFNFLIFFRDLGGRDFAKGLFDDSDKRLRSVHMMMTR